MPEENVEKSPPSYEYNSYVSSDTLMNSIFGCGIDQYFSKDEVDAVLRDPIGNHETAIRLANFIYTKSGIVSNSIDYMTALPCLDFVITHNGIETQKAQNNKSKFKKILKMIDHKSFVRDALFTEMNNGIYFYYFDVKGKKQSNQKFLSDIDIDAISEINDAAINATITTLPYERCQIIGKRNGRYEIAFDLRFFDEFTGEKLENKLRRYPQEIVDGYTKYKKNGTSGAHWVRLDNKHTMCRKVKCKDSEPWGRPMCISALDDILYRDQFIDTKRKVMDELVNKIIYQTLPEGNQKGVCALTSDQQKNQHEMIKNAVMVKNNRGGTSFFTVAAGTKVDTIDTSVDIFDDKNESMLVDQISLDMGICASLIGCNTTGNYASVSQNLEMITAQLYNWIHDIQEDLNYVINKNVICDDNNEVSIYYFPTSFVNKDKFFEQMKTLYLTAGGSLTYFIASSGIDVDTYFNVLNNEIENGYFEKYLPHATSYTLSDSADKQNPDGNSGLKVGRPKNENPTNENTINSQANNGNSLPS